MSFVEITGKAKPTGNGPPTPKGKAPKANPKGIGMTPKENQRASLKVKEKEKANQKEKAPKANQKAKANLRHLSHHPQVGLRVARREPSHAVHISKEHALKQKHVTTFTR